MEPGLLPRRGLRQLSGRRLPGVFQRQRAQPDGLQEPETLRERHHRERGRSAARHARGLRRAHLRRHRELPAGRQDLPRSGAQPARRNRARDGAAGDGARGLVQGVRLLRGQGAPAAAGQEPACRRQQAAAPAQPQHGDDPGLGARVPARHHRSDRGLRRRRAPAQHPAARGRLRGRLHPALHGNERPRAALVGLPRAGCDQHLGRHPQVRLCRQGRLHDHLPQPGTAQTPDVRLPGLARRRVRLAGAAGHPAGRRLRGGLGGHAAFRQIGLPRPGPAHHPGLRPHAQGDRKDARALRDG